MKYYVKKASDQDVSRTMVINAEAAIHFFGVQLHRRDDEAVVEVKYPSTSKSVQTKIRKKQDIRIFVEKTGLETGDLIIFYKLSDKSFSFTIVKQADPRYNGLNSKLNNNYLLTDELNIETEKNTMAKNLNTIFFGPPGTGKTDSTIEASLKILGIESSDTDEKKKRTENREIFRSLLNQRIFFVTMHPSYSYEDFVQSLKPKTDNGNLLFEIKDGIFKKVADIANKTFQDEGEVVQNNIDNKDLLRICFFLSKFNTKSEKQANNYFGHESNSDTFSFLGQKYNINPNSIKNHRDKIDFLASSDRQGWRPHNSSEKLDNTELWPYQDIFEELKNKSFDEMKGIITSIEVKANLQNKEYKENVNFVIILDEINRANISKVFGELVTLIEEDKRIGSENELIVTLPSGESFGVPPNLYIIGTMNTADKSIALVDIALRRRFQFVPVYPDPDLIDKFGFGEDKNLKKTFLTKLNEVLLKDKGVDFQVGHAYFLKDSTLTDIINQNILPLLTEYYRNDLKTVLEKMDKIGFALDKDYFEKTGLLKY